MANNQLVLLRSTAPGIGRLATLLAIALACAACDGDTDGVTSGDSGAGDTAGGDSVGGDGDMLSGDESANTGWYALGGSASGDGISSSGLTFGAPALDYGNRMCVAWSESADIFVRCHD